jgi:hypothetical protein
MVRQRIQLCLIVPVVVKLAYNIMIVESIRIVERLQDCDLGGLIEFAQHGLQVDLGFMVIESTARTFHVDVEPLSR